MKSIIREPSKSKELKHWNREPHPRRIRSGYICSIFFCKKFALVGHDVCAKHVNFRGEKE